MSKIRVSLCREAEGGMDAVAHRLGRLNEAC